MIEITELFWKANWLKITFCKVEFWIKDIPELLGTVHCHVSPVKFIFVLISGSTGASPLQIDWYFGVIEKDGNKPTSTVTESVFLHPFTSVPITLYVVFVDGDTESFAVIGPWSQT